MSEELTAIKKYHEITKHLRRRIWAEDHTLDWGSEPDLYKTYEGGQKFNLKVNVDLPMGDVFSAIRAASAALALKEAGPSLDELSQILHLSYGITRRKTYKDYTFDFRAAPSAGALYPIELYLCIGSVEGIEDGLYHYSVKEDRMVLLKKGDLLGQAIKACAFGDEPGKLRILFILTSIFWRSVWKYRGRAYRYCLLDAGHLAANLLLTSSALGYRAAFIPDFIDAMLNGILGVDGLREAALCAVGIEAKTAAAREIAQGVSIIELNAKAGLEDIYKGEKRYETIESLHKITSLRSLPRPYKAEPEGKRASSQRSAEGAKSIGLGGEPLAPGAGADLGQAMYERRSVRKYARKAITFDEISAILGSSAQGFCWAGINGPLEGALVDGMLSIYLQAGSIISVPEGVYLYSCSERALIEASRGSMKDQAWKACMEQDSVLDAGFALFICADFNDAYLRHGPRSYRYIHLLAGMIVQNLYLTGQALGFGACAIGAFYDDDILELLGLQPNGQGAIYAAVAGKRR